MLEHYFVQVLIPLYLYVFSEEIIRILKNFF